MAAEKYDADVPATRDYWKQNDWQCNCLYCGNYRAALPSHAPEAVRLLDSLGLRYDHALEIMECGRNDAGTGRLYYAYYPVQGTLGEDGLILYEKDAVITLYQPDSSRLHCPSTTMKPPYFMAEVSLQLPWVLEEEP